MKTRSLDSQIRDCVRKFSENDVRYLYPRLLQRVGADLSEALVYVEDKVPDLHKLLDTSVDADNLYNMVDTIEYFMNEEARRARG